MIICNQLLSHTPCVTVQRGYETKQSPWQVDKPTQNSNFWGSETKSQPLILPSQSSHKTASAYTHKPLFIPSLYSKISNSSDHKIQKLASSFTKCPETTCFRSLVNSLPIEHLTMPGLSDQETLGVHLSIRPPIMLPHRMQQNAILTKDLCIVISQVRLRAGTSDTKSVEFNPTKAPQATRSHAYAISRPRVLNPIVTKKEGSPEVTQPMH